MRDIKYRGFVLENNAWVYGYYGKLETLHGEKHFIIEPTVTFNPTVSSYFIDHEVETSSIGECIGLKDKNGVEIYEGDILTSNQYPFQVDDEYNYHGIIEWVDELAAFYLTKRLVNSDRVGISDGLSEQIENIELFEVIGNIYSNPELLNQ